LTDKHVGGLEAERAMVERGPWQIVWSDIVGGIGSGGDLGWCVSDPTLREPATNEASNRVRT
jgi:hypothetical protein